MKPTTRKPYMSDDEIEASFRGARNPKTQIGIIAELNSCGKEEIIEALERKGYEFPEYIKKKKNPEEIVEDARAKAREEVEKIAASKEEDVQQDTPKSRRGRPPKKKGPEITTDMMENPSVRRDIPVSVYATLKEKIVELRQKKQRYESMITCVETEIKELEEFLKPIP